MGYQEEDSVAFGVFVFAAWALWSAALWRRATPAMFFPASTKAKKELATAQAEASQAGRDSNPSAFTAHAKAQRRAVAAEKAYDAAVAEERRSRGAVYRWVPTLVRSVILYGALLPLWALYGDCQVVMLPHAVTSFGIEPFGDAASGAARMVGGGHGGRPVLPLPFLGGVRSLNGPAWYVLCHLALRWAARILTRQ